MSSLLFDCPLPAAIPTIVQPACPVRFGQIQRIALRLTQDPENATPTFATAADILDKAKWVAAIAASDLEKIQLTPYISGHVIPPGTPIVEEGNNNNTVNGIQLLLGMQNAMITGNFKDLPPSVADVLRQFTPWSSLTAGFTKLEAFLINEFGQILYTFEPGGVIPKGFDIYNWIIPSVGSEGMVKSNVTNLQYEMLGTWDKGMAIASPMKNGTPAVWNPLLLA